MPHPTAVEGTQVINVDEGSQIRALIVYQANMGSEFDIDPRDDTSNRGLKPIKKLVQQQLEPKPRQCMRLRGDLISHEHRRIANVLCKNMNLLS